MKVPFAPGRDRNSHWLIGAPAGEAPSRGENKAARRGLQLVNLPEKSVLAAVAGVKEVEA